MTFSDVPIDKYLAQDYRNTMKTGGSPQNVDSLAPIIPVVDIQKGFPKPNSKQTLRTCFLNLTAAASNIQIATKSSQYDYYFLGATFQGTTGKPRNTYIWDGTSGTSPTTTGDTANLDDSLYDTIRNSPNEFVFIPLPIKVKNGIRIHNDAVVGGADFVMVYFIEELIQ